MKSGDITQRLATAESPHLPLALEEHKEKWCSQSPCSLATKTNGVSVRTAVSIITSLLLLRKPGARALITPEDPGRVKSCVSVAACGVLVEPRRAASAGGTTQSGEQQQQQQKWLSLPSSKLLPSSSLIDRNYREASWEESLFCRFLALHDQRGIIRKGIYGAEGQWTSYWPNCLIYYSGQRKIYSK